MTWMAIILMCKVGVCFTLTGPMGQPTVFFPSEEACKETAQYVSDSMRSDPGLTVTTMCVNWGTPV